MKCIYVLSVLVAVAVAQDTYKYDIENFSIEDVAADKATLKSFVDCFIETAPCVGLANDFKKNARETIELNCAKCDDKTKHIVKVFMAEFPKQLPEEYEKFKAFYDPEGKYIPALNEATANS